MEIYMEICTLLLCYGFHVFSPYSALPGNMAILLAVNQRTSMIEVHKIYIMGEN